MMTNLHTRSTPTPDREDKESATAGDGPSTINHQPSTDIGSALRAGQSEAIADALRLGSTSIPPVAVGDPPAAPNQSTEVKSRIRHLKSKIAAVLGFLVLGTSLVLGAWTLDINAASVLIAEVPAPSPHALGSWLISAAAGLSILVLGKQFMRKTPLEAEFLTKREFQDFKDKDFADLRNRIEHSHESLSNKLDSINTRLSEVGSLVARLDERTKLHAVNSVPSLHSVLKNTSPENPS